MLFLIVLLIVLKISENGIISIKILINAIRFFSSVSCDTSNDDIYNILTCLMFEYFVNIPLIYHLQ